MHTLAKSLAAFLTVVQLSACTQSHPKRQTLEQQLNQDRATVSFQQTKQRLMERSSLVSVTFRDVVELLGKPKSAWGGSIGETNMIFVYKADELFSIEFRGLHPPPLNLYGVVKGDLGGPSGSFSKSLEVQVKHDAVIIIEK